MDWFDKNNDEIKRIMGLYNFDERFLAVAGPESMFFGESIVTLYLLNRGVDTVTHHNWQIISFHSKNNYKLELTEVEYNVFPFLKKYKIAWAILFNGRFSLILEK